MTIVPQNGESNGKEQGRINWNLGICRDYIDMFTNFVVLDS